MSDEALILFTACIFFQVEKKATGEMIVLFDDDA